MTTPCSGESPELRVTVERTTRAAKPDDVEEKLIDARLKSEHLTLDELRDLVLHGATWCPGIFNGARCSENFTQAQLVALDMEDGIGPDEALDICKSYDIMPCWGYYSFYHATQAPRYRLVWRTDHVLGDRQVYEIATNALARLFRGTADQSCVSAAWRFYGTSHGDFRFEPDSVVSLQQLVDAYTDEEYHRDKTNASKSISKFAGSHGLDLVASGVISLANCVVLAGPDTTFEADGELKTRPVVIVPPHSAQTAEPAGSHPYASATNSGDFLYNIYRNSPPISMTADTMGPKTANRRLELIHEGSEWSGPAGRKLREDVNFELLKANCPLMSDLACGIPLRYNETWGLMTSLLTCKGGETCFKKCIQNRLEWQQDPRYRNKWNGQIRRFKPYNLPQECENLGCRYIGNCDHIYTPLDQLPLQKGHFRQIEDPRPMVTLAEAEARCRASIRTALGSRDGAIHLIRIETAVGKTLMLLGMKGYVLAAPTHGLAGEMLQTARQLGNDPILVPELPSVDSSFDAVIEECFRVGDLKRARSLVSARLRQAELTPSEMRTAGEDALIEHAKILEQIRNPGGRLVICTHRRLLLMDTPPYDVVVFDEDVLFKSQMDVVQVDKRTIDAVPCLSKLAGTIEGSTRGVVSHVPEGVLPAREQFRKEIRKLRRKHSTDNIMRVLDCDRFVITDRSGLAFGRMLPLPKDATIVVVSATVDHELYNAANPARDVYLDADITNVEHVGQIIQDPTQGISRNQMDRGAADSALDAIAIVAGDDPVLTMKGYSEKLESHGLNVHSDLHMDNCEGSNLLAGQDIVVVGTPNRNEAAYLMYADLLGIPVDSSDRLTYCPVKRNGWEFRTMTYPNNERLRHLQLHLVESTLIQAAGRGRTLRNNCTCRIFANVIIPGARIERMLKNARGKLSEPEAVEEEAEITCCRAA